MLLQFLTRELRLICEDQNLAQEQLGEDARPFLAALADLRAASNLAEAPPGLFDVLQGEELQYVVILSDYQLVFAPNLMRRPIAEDGTLDLHQVNRIKIVGIERHV